MAGAGYLFSLPPEFFDDLNCLTDGDAPQPSDARATSRSVDEAGQQEVSTAAAGSSQSAAAWSEGMGATCIACGIGINSQGFTSSAEQRQHFRTDWHRYNVKRRLEKKPPVTESAFEAMIEQEDDVSSISGSDTSDSSESDVSEDEALVGQQPAGSSSRRSAKGQKSSTTVVQGAQVVFQARGDDAFAVWRCLLLPDNKQKQDEPQSQQQLLQRLRQLRTSADIPPGSNADAAAAAAAAGSEAAGGCVWAVFMLRGGHFAGAVVRMNSSSSSKGKGRQSAQQALAAADSSSSIRAGQGASSSSSGSQQSRQQRQEKGQPVPGCPPGGEPFTVLAHKTFHRYVVRAKAGGKQSTKDATGKFARSAGSRLRRYNEAALSRDITALVKEWGPLLAASGLIFVAAPGSNGRVLFDAAAEAAPTVRQGSGGPLDPADPRVRRVPFVTQRPTFSELKRVIWVLASVRKVTLPDPAQQAAAAAAAAEGAKKEEAQASKQQEKAAAAAAAAAAVVQPPMPAVKKQEDPPLIRASKAGDAERVSRLLANGHDPTVRDAKGRSPYQLAANKEVRDAFRRYMAQAPDAWDYSASDIPSPLTDELEAAQQSKKADKRARQRAKEKERKDGKEAAAANNGGSKGSSTAAAAGGDDSFDAELAAAMAEAAAISSRSSASASKSKQVGGGGSSSRRGGSGSSSAAAAAAAARPPSAEEVARRREQLAAAAEARLKTLQQKQQLW